MQFTKAQRKQAKLRLAISGPAGSGKTWGALSVARGLGGKVAVIDTERGSASLYSDAFEFDTLDLAPPYTPERYIEAIRLAERSGFDILIIDSLTHEWNGIGGCLEINDALAASRYKGNTWAAWNETTPRHRAFLDAILQSPLHVIGTIRSKTETVQDGDKKVRKVGMKAEQREGNEYEFTTHLELDHGTHLAVASKDRTQLFRDPVQLSDSIGVALRNWLENGVDPVRQHEVRIRNAATLDDLKNAWVAVVADRTLTTANRTELGVMKDARKIELSPADAPAVA